MKTIFIAFFIHFIVFFLTALTATAQTIETVGSSGATYTTLKGAFDAINSGTLTGSISLQVVAGTTETVTAVLNESGSGSANYTDILIYPTTAALTITGSLTAPLIDLNGADHVTIDGRVNASGTTASLTIVNTSTGNTAATSTIRFINDAISNLVEYCYVKGSSTIASSGIFFFSTAGAGTGNDNNSISNNYITNGGGRPLNAIFAAGTAGKENSGNIISNNNIYDFVHGSTGNCGIQLLNDNTDFSILNNSFYETTAWNPSNTSFSVININNTSGNNFILSGNYIGGRAPICGGAAWTKGGGGRDGFTCINMNVGTITASSIQGNTIQNFNYSNNSNTRDFTGINIGAGSVNVGTISGNIIGSGSGNGSITGSNVAVLSGIIMTGSGTVTVENNIIGALTNNAVGSHIFAINSSVSGNFTIRNNTIGSTATVNSIYDAGNNTGNTQLVYGIYSTGGGSGIISGNTIANLANNTAAAGSMIAAINYSGGASTTTISKNFISNLLPTNNTATVVSVYGIYAGSGGATITNNIISSGTATPATFYGISDLGGTNNLYHNTVYIAGIPISGANPSYAIFSNGSNTRDYRNNIFMNVRSNNGATGKNYAISILSAPAIIDYNTYYAAGTDAVLGSFNGVDKTVIADWKAATTADCSSYADNPLLSAAGGSNAADYLPANAALKAMPGTGITTDYSSAVRSTAVPSMGALEYAITPGTNSLNIASFFPTSASPGNNVTITGTNFTGATGVTINGITIPVFTVNNTTEIVVTLPFVHATTGKVAVTLSCGSTSSTGDFILVSTLPLNLISFTAIQTSQTALLNWVTAQEQNMDRFVVQHSSNGIDWLTAGEVNATGNSNTTNTYSYSYLGLARGISYFRLQQKNIDGRSTYSKVVSLINNGKTMPVVLLENIAAQGNLHIQVNENAAIRILNQTGQVIKIQICTAGNQFIHLGGSPSGLYFLEVNGVVSKFIIQ